MSKDPFGAWTRRGSGDDAVHYISLEKLQAAGMPGISKLPFTIKILTEAAARQCDGELITADDVRRVASWKPKADERGEVPFRPSRVILQDLTGVPAVVDLAAMRSAMSRLGGNPSEINPQIPVDLVVDHSVQVDLFGSGEALKFNMDREFERNEERYQFLHWAQKAFANFKVVPPATGIVHQVNLEYLATVVQKRTEDGVLMAFPDTLVGTDSHTTMINGLGVLGWGVGGIEAEAAMLGQPLYFVSPEVVGFKLTGELPEGATATDLALTVTQMLRQHGVVGKFVEFYGSGLDHITLADRATVANMAPEYGATASYFPVDDMTLEYLRLTGRSDEHIEMVEWYLKEQGLFRTPSTPDPAFSETLELDLGTLEPTLAGPKRPQDRVALSEMKSAFRSALKAPVGPSGFGLEDDVLERRALVHHPDGRTSTLENGSVVIAAITSCTNTSNPTVMLGAGLLAKKAVERGLTVPGYVKTSLAPGSKVVTQYLKDAGLTEYLDDLGFNLVGYGCTTCIGNSGPLPEEVAKAIDEEDLTVAAVLSGNRNFEGRIHAQSRANYLASPPLVVAYALAGTVDIDLYNEPIGYDADDKPVFLKDIWPSRKEILDAMKAAVKPELFRQQYARVYDENERWNQLESPKGELYEWDPDSTYVKEPPFFEGWSPGDVTRPTIKDARVLLYLGDTITTDHISPAGYIPPKSPAGQYLTEHGVELRDFNSYGSRRGNHEVMMRGTFANIRIRNKMAPGTEGGFSTHLPSGDVDSVFDVAERYQKDGTPLIVLAGKEYGTGSSRDWAAKGPLLQGVRAVIAESFERIHRSNLVGMGVLPLQFAPGESAEKLGLTGKEYFTVEGAEEPLSPLKKLKVTARAEDGKETSFTATARLDTPVDVTYFENHGILQTVLKNMLADEGK